MRGTGLSEGTRPPGSAGGTPTAAMGPSIGTGHRDAVFSWPLQQALEALVQQGPRPGPAAWQQQQQQQQHESGQQQGPNGAPPAAPARAGQDGATAAAAKLAAAREKNRLAQQRFRERQRAKQKEAGAQCEVLQQEMEQLEYENQQLHRQNEIYAKVLAVRDAMLHTLTTLHGLPQQARQQAQDAQQAGQEQQQHPPALLPSEAAAAAAAAAAQGLARALDELPNEQEMEDAAPEGSSPAATAATDTPSAAVAAGAQQAAGGQQEQLGSASSGSYDTGAAAAAAAGAAGATGAAAPVGAAQDQAGGGEEREEQQQQPPGTLAGRERRAPASTEQQAGTEGGTQEGACEGEGEAEMAAEAESGERQQRAQQGQSPAAPQSILGEAHRTGVAGQLDGSVLEEVELIPPASNQAVLAKIADMAGPEDLLGFVRQWQAELSVAYQAADRAGFDPTSVAQVEAVVDRMTEMWWHVGQLRPAWLSALAYTAYPENSGQLPLWREIAAEVLPHMDEGGRTMVRRSWHNYSKRLAKAAVGASRWVRRLQEYTLQPMDAMASHAGQSLELAEITSHIKAAVQEEYIASMEFVAAQFPVSSTLLKAYVNYRSSPWLPDLVAIVWNILLLDAEERGAPAATAATITAAAAAHPAHARAQAAQQQAHSTGSGGSSGAPVRAPPLPAARPVSQQSELSAGGAPSDGTK